MAATSYQLLFSKIIPENTLLMENKIHGPKASFRSVISQLLKQPVENMPDLFVCETHGGEHHIKFDDGVLCGASLNAHNTTMHAAGTFSTPSCGYGRSCFMQDVIPIRDLTVKNIFTSACNSLKPGETAYATRYNIGLNALDGVALTYVGACMVDEAKSSDVFLYIAALQSGMSVGEAVCLLNNVSRGYFPSFCTFFLIGNPQGRVIEPIEHIYQATVKRLKDQHWEVEVNVTSASLITIRIPLQKGLDVNLLCCKALDMQKNLPDPLYFTFVDQQDEVLLYLYTTGAGFSPGQYSFSVSQIPSVVTDIRARVSRFLAAYQAVIATRLLPERWVEQHINDAKEMVAVLIQELSVVFVQGNLTIQVISEIENTVQTLLEHLKQIDHELLQYLLQYNGAGLRSYLLKIEDTFYPGHATEGTLPCLCGNDMTIRPVHHVALDYTLTGHFCPRCGFIYHSLRGGLTNPFLTFRHVSHAIDGQDWIVEAMVCNPTNRYIEGYASLLVKLNSDQIRPSKDQQLICIPQQAFLSIAPGETVTQTFNLRSNGFRSGMHDLFVCFVSELTIHLLQCEIFMTALPKDSITIN